MAELPTPTPVPQGEPQGVPQVEPRRQAPPGPEGHPDYHWAPRPLHEQPLQDRVDHHLNEPDSWQGRLIELSIGALILAVCAIYVVTASELATGTLLAALVATETAITAVFLVEYLVRWWSKRFSLRYLLTPLALVDLVSILPLFLPAGHLQFVRVLRLFRVLRLLRLVQSQKFFFGEVTPAHLQVIRILFTIFCIVFITGGMVYEFEHDEQGEKFHTLFDALYFAIVTLTTVGFGDLTPLTWQGRAITMVMILTGVLVIPWQLTNLMSTIVRTSNKVDTMCRHCGLRYHDPDASHCKSCGNLIFQPYEG